MNYAAFNLTHRHLYEKIEGTGLSVLEELGPEVGPGWLPLLDSVLTVVANELVAAPHDDFAIIEIKEKWGHLSLLWRGGNEHICALLSKAQSTSEIVCEDCGNFGLLRKFEDGWYATACGMCSEERGEHIVIWGWNSRASHRP